MTGTVLREIVRETKLLSDSELDKAGAEEVMGWSPYNISPRTDSVVNYWGERERGGKELKLYTMVEMWTPTHDIAQAWQMQERIVELGDKHIIEYLIALVITIADNPELVLGTGRKTYLDFAFRWFAFATPRQRSVAALACVRKLSRKEKVLSHNS